MNESNEDKPAETIESMQDHAVPASPLCRRGTRIEMQHDLGIHGRCTVCGWEYPKLNIR